MTFSTWPPLLPTQAGLLFDNEGPVFFSVFMSLWAVTFLVHWKPSSAVLAHRWDCSEVEAIVARLRWLSMCLGCYVTVGLSGLRSRCLQGFEEMDSA